MTHNGTVESRINFGCSALFGGKVDKKQHLS
jgi:hypothetical protein